MKQCSKCDQTYTDYSLKFCFSAGTELIPMPRKSDAAAAADLPSTGKGSAGKQRAAYPMAAYLVIGIAAVLVGVAVIAWIRFDSSSTGNEISSAASNQASEQATAEIEKLNQQKENLRLEQARLERDRLQLENEKIKRLNEEERSSNRTNDPPPPASRAATGNWFVILGSYSRQDTEKAKQRLQYIQNLGHQATIIDTDSYPKLGNGLFSVVLGPYSKSDAINSLARLKSAVPDAYIKSAR